MKNIENDDLKRALGPTVDCPPVENLISGALSVSERNHLSLCPHCKAELAMYLEYQGPLDAGEAPHVQWIAAALQANVKTKPPAAKWWQTKLSSRFLMPSAVALASFVALVSIVQISRNVDQPGVHVSATQTMRSQTVEARAPLGRVTELPKGFVWMPFPNAASYSVRVMEVDRSLLWETRVRGTSVPLPSNIARNIVPLKRLLWEVTALDANGRPMASSSDANFVLITRN